MLIGQGYDQSAESDILLLDISNNDEYKWTDIFDPSPPSPPSPPPSISPSAQQQSSNKSVMIGAIVGSLFGGILLTIGGFLLHRWNKNKQKQANALPIPGNVQQIPTTDHELRRNP